MLARYRLSPGRVIVELTEREAITDLERLRRNVAALQHAGVRIAADDVGAGNAGPAAPLPAPLRHRQDRPLARPGRHPARLVAQRPALAHGPRRPAGCRGHRRGPRDGRAAARAPRARHHDGPGLPAGPARAQPRPRPASTSRRSRPAPSSSASRPRCAAPRSRQRRPSAPEASRGTSAVAEPGTGVHAGPSSRDGGRVADVAPRPPEASAAARRRLSHPPAPAAPAPDPASAAPPGPHRLHSAAWRPSRSSRASATSPGCCSGPLALGSFGAHLAAAPDDRRDAPASWASAPSWPASSALAGWPPSGACRRRRSWPSSGGAGLDEPRRVAIALFAVLALLSGRPLPARRAGALAGSARHPRRAWRPWPWRPGPGRAARRWPCPCSSSCCALTVVTGGSMAAVVLAHWYLVTPRISERPLVLTHAPPLLGHRRPAAALRDVAGRRHPRRRALRRAHRPERRLRLAAARRRPALPAGARVDGLADGPDAVDGVGDRPALHRARAWSWPRRSWPPASPSAKAAGLRCASQVRLFAMQRAQIGRARVDLELPEGATSADAWAALVADFPVLAPATASVRFARNGRYVEADATLAAGDELAVIPPVAGGAPAPPSRPTPPDVPDDRRRHLAIVEAPIDDALLGQLRARAGHACRRRRRHRSSGRRARRPARRLRARRPRPPGSPVSASTGLSYEAFEPMVLAVLGEIADEIEARFGVRRLAIVHRVGEVAVGEASVVIAVAAPHREAAFAACRYAIEELKARAPIWKAERFADGERLDGRAGASRPTPRTPSRPSASLLVPHWGYDWAMSATRDPGPWVHRPRLASRRPATWPIPLRAPAGHSLVGAARTRLAGAAHGTRVHLVARAGPPPADRPLVRHPAARPRRRPPHRDARAGPQLRLAAHPRGRPRLRGRAGSSATSPAPRCRPSCSSAGAWPASARTWAP